MTARPCACAIQTLDIASACIILTFEQMDTPPNDRENAGNSSDGSEVAREHGGETPSNEHSGTSNSPIEGQPSGAEIGSNLPPVGAGVFGPPQEAPTAPTGYAYYPRYYPQTKGPVPSPPAVVRFAAIGEAWQLIREDFGTFSVSCLVYAVLAWIVGTIVQMPLQVMMMGNMPTMTRQPPTNLWDLIPHTFQFWSIYAIVNLVTQAAMFVFGAGLFSICLKRLRGEVYGVANLFDGFKFIGPLAVAGVVVAVIKTIALLCFVLPDFIAVGAFAFVPLIIIDQKAGPFEAMALSFSSLKKEVLVMGMLVFVTYLLSSLGVCACIIGAIFTGPLYYMTIALHYHGFFPPQGGPETARVMPAVPQYSV